MEGTYSIFVIFLIVMAGTPQRFAHTLRRRNGVDRGYGNCSPRLYLARTHFEATSYFGRSHVGASHRPPVHHDHELLNYNVHTATLLCSDLHSTATLCVLAEDKSPHGNLSALAWIPTVWGHQDGISSNLTGRG